MIDPLRHVQPPHGFIVLNGKYILVRVSYVPANDQDNVPCWEFQRLIEIELCQLSSILGSLLVAKDAFPVKVPFGGLGGSVTMRCVIEQRYLRKPAGPEDAEEGINADLIAAFVVHGDL